MLFDTLKKKSKLSLRESDRDRRRERDLNRPNIVPSSSFLLLLSALIYRYLYYIYLLAYSLQYNNDKQHTHYSRVFKNRSSFTNEQQTMTI